MSLPSRLKVIQPVIIVLVLAVFLRTWAVALLLEEFDEPTYLGIL